MYGAGEKDQSVSNGGLGDLGCRDLGKGLSEGEADGGRDFPQRPLSTIPTLSLQLRPLANFPCPKSGAGWGTAHVPTPSPAALPQPYLFMTLFWGGVAGVPGTEPESSDPKIRRGAQGAAGCVCWGPGPGAAAVAAGTSCPSLAPWLRLSSSVRPALPVPQG